MIRWPHSPQNARGLANDRCAGSAGGDVYPLPVPHGRHIFVDMKRSLIALLLPAVAACVEEATITPFPQQVIPTTITTSDTDLQPGETATLTISITNTLEEQVQMTFPTSCQAVVFIRNDNGRVTTPPNGQYLCAAVPSSLILAPGETKTFTREWGGGVDFGAAGTSERVPAGSYYASGELRSDGYLAIAFPILIVVH